MSFLLDTNTVFEPLRPRPDRQVLQWLADADEDGVFVSVITLGELRKGVALLPDGRRRRALDEWVTGQVPERFSGRILDVGHDIADEWGRLTARGQSSGVNVGAVDALLAATALVHGLAVVTRNVEHFRPMRVDVVNPWTQ